MLRKDFVLCKTKNLLNEFMAPITAKADKPRRKFLRQAVGAILLSNHRMRPRRTVIPQACTS